MSRRTSQRKGGHRGGLTTSADKLAENGSIGCTDTKMVDKKMDMNPSTCHQLLEEKSFGKDLRVGWSRSNFIVLAVSFLVWFTTVSYIYLKRSEHNSEVAVDSIVSPTPSPGSASVGVELSNKAGVINSADQWINTHRIFHPEKSSYINVNNDELLFDVTLTIGDLTGVLYHEGKSDNTPQGPSNTVKISPNTKTEHTLFEAEEITKWVIACSENAEDDINLDRLISDVSAAISLHGLNNVISLSPFRDVDIDGDFHTVFLSYLRNVFGKSSINNVYQRFLYHSEATVSDLYRDADVIQSAAGYHSNKASVSVHAPAEDVSVIMERYMEWLLRRVEQVVNCDEYRDMLLRWDDKHTSSMFTVGDPDGEIARNHADIVPVNRALSVACDAFVKFIQISPFTRNNEAVALVLSSSILHVLLGLPVIPALHVDDSISHMTTAIQYGDYEPMYVMYMEGLMRSMNTLLDLIMKDLPSLSDKNS